MEEDCFSNLNQNTTAGPLHLPSEFEIEVDSVSVASAPALVVQQGDATVPFKSTVPHMQRVSTSDGLRLF